MTESPPRPTAPGARRSLDAATVRRLELLALVGIVAAGAVLRFVTRSPLWLDEALSVNIARLPLGEIGGALRHDGHPPLYYYLLHVWMDAFGTGDGAVRALSGVFGLLTLPLAWIGGRRLGGRSAAWGAVIVLALSPYALRYATETRMYSMVMVLVLAGWLLAGDALRDPAWWRLAAIAVLSGLLLLTHYWGFWFLGTAGIVLLVRAWRSRGAVRNATIRVIVAVAAGGILFLPWLPAFLYQSQHTGTPWATPVRPTRIITDSIVDFGGGGTPEGLLLGITLVVLVLLALFARARDARHLDVDLATQPEARTELVLVAGTIAVAAVAGYATHSTFASRYAAVYFPFVVLAVGVGISRFAGPLARWTIVVAVVALSLVGGARNVTTDRSQSRMIADAIEHRGRPGDIVAYCPDQLAPAVHRELPPGFSEVSYYDELGPERVDWVDYKDRMNASRPVAFAQALLRRGEGHTIWLVWNGGYKTLEGTCEKVVNGLLRARPDGRPVVADDGGFFEHAALFRYPSP
jgi:uncharacterized membrane protein